MKITENIEILLGPHEEDSSVDREISVYLKECEFFESLIRTFKMTNFDRDFENPMINRMSCFILAAYANWCKDKKTYLFEQRIFSARHYHLDRQ